MSESPLQRFACYRKSSPKAVPVRTSPAFTNSTPSPSTLVLASEENLPKVAAYNPFPFPQPKLPSMKELFLADLVFIDADGYLYIRSEAMLKLFEKYLEGWQGEFASCGKVDFSQLRIGQPCLIRYTGDGKFYRGTFVGKVGNQRQYFYEDFGNVESVKDDDVRALKTGMVSGYNAATSILICKVISPVKPETDYAVLQAYDISLIREWIGKDLLVDVEVWHYKSEFLHGMQRVVLFVDAFAPDDKVGLVDRLRQSNPNLQFKAIHENKVDFGSELHVRRCVRVCFDEPLDPPLNKMIYVKLISVDNSAEDLVLVSYVTVEKELLRSSNFCEQIKCIYGEAAVLEAMIKRWTEERTELLRAKHVVLSSSYLVYHKGLNSICRAEVYEVTELDEFHSPAKVKIYLIDHGIFLEIPVEELLELPAVVTSPIPIQAFLAKVVFNGDAFSEPTKYHQKKNRWSRFLPQPLVRRLFSVAEEDSDHDFNPLSSLDNIRKEEGKRLVAIFTALDGDLPVLQLYTEAYQQPIIDWAGG